MQNIEVKIQKKIWFSLVGGHLIFFRFYLPIVLPGTSRNTRKNIKHDGRGLV